MLKYSGLIGCFLMGLLASAQPGWNWPNDPEGEKLAKEKQAYYKVQMQLEKYQGAFNSLMWLYENAPDLNQSIYIDGAKVIDKLLSTKMTESRKKVLQDSMLWTFDARLKHFDDKASVIDRKAYAAFKMYYKTQSEYPLLLDLYEQLYACNPLDISEFNLTPYITLATYYYKSNPSEMPAEKVLDIHETITNVIDQKIQKGGNKEKLQKEQDKIDAFLSSLGEILNCDFIETKLVPKFNENPNNLNLAKKIFSYSIKAKCTDKPYFVQAGETYFKTNPSFSLAKALADRFYGARDFEKALEYYSRAEKQATGDEQKFEAKMGRASSFSKQGNKQKARAMAYEALSVKPEANEPYNLIGNLYFSSYDDCKGGESKVADRVVFIAAYKMYEKAGNTDQMAASKEQFPSIEEIFNESMEEGQKVTVDCWVNESVVLQRRP